MTRVDLLARHREALTTAAVTDEIDVDAFDDDRLWGWAPLDFDPSRFVPEGTDQEMRAPRPLEAGY